MHIFSDPAKDLRPGEQKSGGYEWWYFDAISDDGKYSLVVIFYRGNPFSNRYIQAIQEQSGQAVPSKFPAVSISLYEEGEPVYYSFTEFLEAQTHFDDTSPSVRIGRHTAEATIESDRLQYRLNLDEELPSGDRLKARLCFESDRQPISFEAQCSQSAARHQWNLVQQRARVDGEIRLKVKEEKERTVNFDGTGYHDHNRGSEPLRSAFEDWYWGRLHFDKATLVYYIMNKQKGREYRAWLLDQYGTIIKRFDQAVLDDRGFSIFGLYSAHKLQFSSEPFQIQVQQSQKVDDGPFYCRFLSEGYLYNSNTGRTQRALGITEYIYPDRIYARIFWPLVNMRIRQDYEKPHWVQRSGRLYRWTW
ncbi:MAG TPA: hypothetical protein VK112_12785 [Fodinibius sp.]|nr:hypothetical protein [Fodinibius sp.]